ncbi:MAG: alpha/beta hydrolase domain-containing protein [Pseudohongiellaceae bacterium]
MIERAKSLQIRRFTFSCWLMFAGSLAAAAVPEFSISGPIAVDPAGHPSLNMIYSASAIELTSRNYIEEEYFIEGRANRYSNPEFENASILDSGHRYKTRLIVRRPESNSDFNGIVVVEWINVTGGPDKDIDWWQSGEHFVRNGYAYVAVSAQQMGIDTMKEWSPERYDSLDMTHDGMAVRDELSYDVFSAVGKAITRVGQSPSRSLDILAGLRAEQILATGHSQSASRLAVYLNNIHPLEPIYDGVMVHGGGGRIRDDQDVKIFKIMAETDMRRRAAAPQPNSDTFRQWEVAGSSHVDVPFEIEYGKVGRLREGQPLAGVKPRDSGCELPAYSTVPFRDVMNAAFEHLVEWVRTDKLPPIAEPLQVARMFPELTFSRDEFGNILGGIQLAEHAVPTATNTGMNTGANRFCFLYGSHIPFDEETIDALYPSHELYVQKVIQVVEQNLEDGFILPDAAKNTIEAARNSQIGRSGI